MNTHTQVCTRAFEHAYAWSSMHTHPEPRLRQNLVFIYLIIFHMLFDSFCFFRLIVHIYLPSIFYLINLAMFGLFDIFFPVCFI